MLWIDTYQGPPDILTHDAGTNFASAEFRAEAKIMGVTVPTHDDGITAVTVNDQAERGHSEGNKALRKIAAERQVSDALNTRNGPTTGDVLALPLQSEVLVWRKRRLERPV
ncbi:hypothetical protein P3342_004364 [Pyrenophora teres f. teres]|nr:hypothetical protein P3342_004364 [Pyrenophora teres f. teres]